MISLYIYFNVKIRPPPPHCSLTNPWGSWFEQTSINTTWEINASTYVSAILAYIAYVFRGEDFKLFHYIFLCKKTDHLHCGPSLPPGSWFKLSWIILLENATNNIRPFLPKSFLEEVFQRIIYLWSRELWPNPTCIPGDHDWLIVFVCLFFF